jgi:hypothetical protein
MNTQTPDPATVLEQLEILGRKHAVSHFEKGNFLDSPNEEVQKWLDRHQFTPIQKEFDRMYDAYCKGFQSYHVEKWIAGMTSDEMNDLRQRFASTVSCHAEGLLDRPEAIRPPQGENTSCVTDVPPLGEVSEDAIVFKDGEDTLSVVKWVNSCGKFLTMRTDGTVSFSQQQVTSLIAHLSAWLSTGSFVLTPPVSTQSHGDASLPSDRHSDPSSLFNRMAAALRASSLELDHFLSVGEPTKSFAHLETLILGLGELVAELNRLPSPPSTEKPVVQPIVGSPEGPSNDSGGNPPQGADVLPVLTPELRRHLQKSAGTGCSDAELITQMGPQFTGYNPYESADRRSIPSDSARLLEECRGVLQSVQDATEYETVLEGFEQDSGEFRHQLDLKQSELERLRNLLTKLNA